MSTSCTDDTCTIDHGASDDSTNAFGFGPGKHVVYFGDPMCSWCWGFMPELHRIHAALNGRAQFHMVMGGLRPGTPDAWDPQMRDYIRHHWQEVQKKTGQPFNFARFDNVDFVYDTEPACRALVSVRMLKPNATLGMFEALQRAFYAENRNITDDQALADIAHGIGVERQTFLHHFNGTDARTSVAFDFSRTRAYGVSGFPSVLCADDDQFGFLSLGYRPYSALGPMLEEWLNA